MLPNIAKRAELYCKENANYLQRHRCLYTMTWNRLYMGIFAMLLWFCYLVYMCYITEGVLHFFRKLMFLYVCLYNWGCVYETILMNISILCTYLHSVVTSLFLIQKVSYIGAPVWILVAALWWYITLCDDDGDWYYYNVSLGTVTNESIMNLYLFIDMGLIYILITAVISLNTVWTIQQNQYDVDMRY